MAHYNRRTFLKQSAITAGLAAGGSSVVAAPVQKRYATDWVTLGRSGINVTRLGFGTGSNGGRVQRELGQKRFTYLVRYAYDRGIRFFDTADNYGGMHEMLREALNGIDRDTYVLQTKIKIDPSQNVSQTIDRFRKECNSDYFDTFLLHCARTKTWPKDLERLCDGLSEAKSKEILRAQGASVHGLDPLAAMPGCDWLDTSQLRINHNGTKMDGPTGDWMEDGTPYHNQAAAGVKKVHDAGIGVVGMKIIGNGDFTSPQAREASFKYVMGLDFVDAVVIGFKTPKEIDEAIDRMNRHLNA